MTIYEPGMIPVLPNYNKIRVISLTIVRELLQRLRNISRIKIGYPRTVTFEVKQHHP